MDEKRLLSSEVKRKVHGFNGEIRIEENPPFRVNDDDILNKSRMGRILRSRNSSHRILPERVRHKRQVLQDMARPLKQWLVRHRNNPYPTKAEKVSLALGSQMTLVQVSNWFANARRRLKNTVREQQDMSWSKRIRLYNSHVEGNAELLSISSNDSIWDSDSDTQPTAPPGENEVSYKTVERMPSVHLSLAEFCATNDHSYSAPESASPILTPIGNSRVTWIEEKPLGGGSCPAKYKTSILHRYLHDALCNTSTTPSFNKQGGSVSSYDSDLSGSPPVSATSSPTSNGGQKRKFSFSDETAEESSEPSHKKIRSEEPTRLTPANGRYWKELDAAMALTSLARMPLQAKKRSRQDVSSDKDTEGV